MATLLSLTLNVEDMLYGQAMLERPDMDSLATGVISATDTTWQFTSAGSQFWERGDFAEYDDRAGTAGEVIRLMADHSTAATDVTVVRAQRQTSAAAETSVGTATFIFTGSAVEDEWTSAGHGMSVGDEVVFLVAGTGATEYAADTIYWVATVPTADTFQLSATDSTTVLEGTADSVGTWTLSTVAYNDLSQWIKNPPHTRTEIQKAINEVIDNDMQNGIWYRTARTIEYSVGRNRYPVNASDFLIEKMYQRDVSNSSLGAVTFLFTGSAVEDEWTSSAAHELAVGDMVRFSAVGTGADEYAAGLVYYVATIPTTTTFQLSATESTTVLEGTADSVGTWTLETMVFDYQEFPDGYYDLITNVDAVADSTGRSVLVRGLISSSDTIYYTARTRPSSSSVASLPTELANAVPYGVISRLAGGTATRGRPASDSTIAYADASWFRQAFDRMMDQTRKRLLKELAPLKHFEFGPITSGGVRGRSRSDFLG